MIIGIDVGGSNIDGVLIEEKNILRRIKNPVDKNNLFGSIKTVLLELISGLDTEKIQRINLSTTLSTNAIIENKIEKVLTVIQEGPGMKNSFDQIPYLERLDGYVDHRGKLVKDLDLDQVERLKAQEAYKDFSSLAIVSKFSTRNPQAENAIYDRLKDHFTYISLGHSLSGRLNFPRRVYSAYLNSAVSKVFQIFGQSIRAVLEAENIKAPLYILKADGATMTLDQAITKPIESILSGPAASFMGISALERPRGDEIYLDIGGTTTDLFFLVDGSPLYEPLGIEIAGMKTLVKGLYSSSLGLGGDSYVQVQDGKIQIGPQRKDKPLALGGAYLTLTDAFNVLGLASLGDLHKSWDAIKALGGQEDPKALAEKIVDQAAAMIYDHVAKDLEKINSKPLYTVREVLENKILQPRQIKIIGGPAKALAPALEKKFGLKTLCPKDYQIANAIGASLSKPTFEANLQADTKTGLVNIPELNLYKKIPSSFKLADGEKVIKEEMLKKAVQENIQDPQVEILEAASFNMVDYYSFGRNIRIRAQIQGGLLYKLWKEGAEDDQ
ncbi:MAG: hydantoinase/oxoprolinase family protein [Bacillota bacterium]|nr:hydantoinase/oxoprolinase family protein [Bacillota bacterium]